MGRIIKRQMGKPSTTVKYPGRTYYEEVITEGHNKYYIRNSDTGAVDSFVAQLAEIVPVHTPCFKCKKFISNSEADMAEYMIDDECGMCKKKSIENKLDNKLITVKCTHKEQTFVCFECFEDMCNDC